MFNIRINSIYLGPSMVKRTKKYISPNLNFKYNGFQTQETWFKNFKSYYGSLHASIQFYELNIKFEKL